MYNTLPLSEFLTWFVTIGAGIVAYNWIEAHPQLYWVRTFGTWRFWTWELYSFLPSPRLKRVWACALSAGLAITGYLLQLQMGYAPIPATWVAWVESLFAVGTGAFGLSQIIHGAKNLPAARGKSQPIETDLPPPPMN